MKFEIMQKCFGFLCFLVTFGFVIWCFYTYSLDRDLTVISQKNFGDEDNLIMPAMSLCFYDPFIEQNFEKELGSNVSYLEYKKFLLGSIWDQRLLKIEFEKVTKRIENYVVSYDVGWNNESSNTYDNMSSLPEFIKEAYPSYTGHIFGRITKCYAINIPMNASTFGVTLKNGIILNKKRSILNGVGVSFHYPNQFFRSVDNLRFSEKKNIGTQNTSLVMYIKMKTFEVTIRRNSGRVPCEKKWMEYDFSVAQKNYAAIGCRPVYAIWNSSYAPCNSQKLMLISAFTSAASQFDSKNYQPDPCQSADRIVLEYKDVYVNSMPGTSKIFVQMPRTRFKVIQDKREYELQNLIGNSGGYIGLFLGKMLL